MQKVSEKGRMNIGELLICWRFSNLLLLIPVVLGR